jgi:hypothetical protein
MELPAEMADLVVVQVVPVFIQAPIPVAGCRAPTIGVERDDIRVLAADTASRDQGSAQRVDSCRLRQNHLIVTARVACIGKPCLAPAPRVVQGGERFGRKILVSDIGDP